MKYTTLRINRTLAKKTKFNARLERNLVNDSITCIVYRYRSRVRRLVPYGNWMVAGAT